MHRFVAPFLLSAFVLPVSAQTADTSVVRLAEVRVEAARGTVARADDAAFALTLRVRGIADIDTPKDVSAAGLLRAIPGVYASDRAHLALGDRIAVRGQGARAGFGVRGVQVVLDGIPLTLPDGQAVTESIEPGVVRRVESIRGPSARFWGNGSGGVLAFDTVPGDGELPFVRAALTGSAWATRSGLVEAGARTAAGPLRVWASVLDTEGYRDHARGRLVRLGASGRVAVFRSALLRWSAGAVDQDVEAPGALTAAELAVDRRAADPRYVATASGKVSRQGHAGLRLDLPAAGGTAEVSGWGLGRRLENPLPFAWVGVDRRAAGLRAAWRRGSDRFGLDVAIDAATQDDDRVNAANEGGMEGAVRTLEQRETVKALSAGVLGSLRIVRGFSGQAGFRWDRLSLALDDGLTTDGDQSGSRRLGEASPVLGLRWSVGRTTAYASWSTAFESPTTVELVNRADGRPGFNPDLGPQQTRGMEAGVRSDGNAWAIDVSVFDLSIRDLLSSFESPVDGRTVYRNAGRATSRGVDGSVAWTPGRGWKAMAVFLWSKFRFEESGIPVPGVPERVLRLAVSKSIRAVHAELSLDARSALPADDAGTARDPSAAFFHAEVSHALNVAGATVRPFMAVRNALDLERAAAVLPNARGGRSYEPAPGRHLAAGVGVRF